MEICISVPTFLHLQVGEDKNNLVKLFDSKGSS